MDIASRTLAVSFLCAVLAACGGGGGGDSCEGTIFEGFQKIFGGRCTFKSDPPEDDPDNAASGADSQFEIASALLLEGGSRTLRVAAAEPRGGPWNGTWRRGPDDPLQLQCPVDAIRIGSTLTLDGRNGSTLERASIQCWTRTSPHLKTLERFTAGRHAGTYQSLNSGQGIPTAAVVGDTGVLGIWSRFDDNGTPADRTDDAFIGSSDTRWSLTNAAGSGSLELETRHHDASGAEIGRERVEWLIDPAGEVIGLTATLETQQGMLELSD